MSVPGQLEGPRCDKVVSISNTAGPAQAGEGADGDQPRNLPKSATVE